MAVAPLIAMKSTQCESVEAVGRELDRRAHTYRNDIHIGTEPCSDMSAPRRANVYWLCQGVTQGHEHMPLEDAIEHRMAQLNTKRAIRKDAVKAMGFIVSTNDFLDSERAHAFMSDAVQWFARRYGSENVLAAAEHFDEGTPHLHLWLAPVIHEADGHDRLCAKELFAPDKRRKNADGKWEVVSQGTMSQLQQDFFEQVASRYGYERPLDHAKRAKGYRSLEAFKIHAGVTRELKAEISEAERARDRARAAAMVARDEQNRTAAALADVNRDVSQKQALATQLEADVAEAQRRLESVQAAIGEVEKQVRESERRAEGLERQRDEAKARVQGLERRAGSLRERVSGAWKRLVTQARAMVCQVQVPSSLRWVCERLSDVVSGLGWEGGWWGRIGPQEPPERPTATHRPSLDEVLAQAETTAAAWNDERVSQGCVTQRDRVV